MQLVWDSQREKLGLWCPRLIRLPGRVQTPGTRAGLKITSTPEILDHQKKSGSRTTHPKEKQGSFIYFCRLPLLNHSKKNSKCARTRAASETLRPTGKWYVNETNKWSVNTYVNESTWHKHKHKHKRKQHTTTQTQHTGTVDLISKLFVDISFRSPHLHVDTCPLHWPTCNLRADSSHATRGHFSFFGWCVVWEAAGNYPHNTSRMWYYSYMYNIDKTLRVCDVVTNTSPW